MNNLVLPALKILLLPKPSILPSSMIILSL